MKSVAPKLATALAARYRFERELGAGGMATVYLAADLKHDRKVAIKVLRPELAAVLGAERFVAEIKTTAALSHPHILPLFDSGELDGFLFYVMPYIEGETIREKLNRETQCGVEEAIRIAREVADALDYAHRHGVIHRDIKPENILLHDGRAMVMDFGIALAVSAAAGGRLTETGLSLGTPHYMSPEQATADKAITRRSDIYSLASVLYEMLTGEPPHTGASAQQIIMKIVAEPVRPAVELRKSIPPHVAAALAKALEKLPADRFDSAKEFGDALVNLSFRAVSTTAVQLERRAGLLTTAGWGVAAVSTLALGWSLLGRPEAPAAPSTWFAFSLGTEASADLSIDISPDGRRVLMSTQNGLAIRDLGALEPKVLPGIVATLAGIAGVRPAVSPDGQWIAYQSGSAIRKVRIEGGPSTEVGVCRDPDWLDQDHLVCLTSSWGIGRLPVDSGPLEEITVPDTAAGEVGHWAVSPLPGGRAVLFLNYRRPTSRIEALDLVTRRRVVVAENGVNPIYSRSGHVLFARDSALFAVRFDAATLRTDGAPVPVLDDVATLSSNGTAGVAISENGTLAVVRNSEWWADTRVVWVGRDGREEPAIPSSGPFRSPRLSPDQQRILVTVGRDGGKRNLWVYDVRRQLLAQLTRSSMAAFGGVWSPDGRQVAFTNETPSYDLFRIPLDGSTEPQALITNVKDKYAQSVSPDGKNVAYVEAWPPVSRIRIAPLDGSSAGSYVGDAGGTFTTAAVSPDGRWIAASGINGTTRPPHIFVFRADGTPGTIQVSANETGDSDPRWTREGRELVFRRGTAVYAVDIDAANGVIGKERKLFDGGYSPAFGYDVTPNGDRFLMVKVVDRPGVLPILVITNFFAELQRKAGR